MDFTSLLAGLNGAGEGLSRGYSAYLEDKASKRKTKEEKRSTFADMLNKALAARQENYLRSQDVRNSMTAKQAELMQQMAAAFRASLLGG